MNNNKILINLVVPRLSETFNLFIPINKTIAETIILLNQALNDLTQGEFPISKELNLVNCTSGEIYNPDYTIKVSNISFGASLALI